MMDIQSTNFRISNPYRITWCYKPINNELKNQVKKDLDIEKDASILANRGIEGPDLAVFLDHTLKNNMPDPALINDMEKAIKRISHAVLNKEPIGIIGDYDVDGLVSASILFKYLQPYCPVTVKYQNRFNDGYGPNLEFFRGIRAKQHKFNYHSRLRIEFRWI